ncbi:NUDIX domain-containing protein [Halobacterium litoreum]|uniref:NUDIX domain-containing protein n=1 Tax=Halobacterium litoreum TaxID=2039234 RepID=A0ABD5NFC5_9EURY|nr:NUDIX domain-containing protein [Halobacterium litoreum]UHH13173.1 hypothetical protein LT972_13575 [Halobacterium litoreum]
MTTSDPTDSTDALPDPETLAARDAVAYEETTTEVDADQFDAAEAWDSHVVVGVADDRGALLQNDGHHGWTLPAFPVEPGADYAAVARREFEALAGVSATIEGASFVRKRTARASDGDERVVWNVVLDATPAEPLSDDPESRVDDTELAWFDAPPADAPDPVADDVRRVLDGADPTASLTDPEALADRGDVDYVEVSDDSHFEMNRDTEGVAVVGVTSDGRLALPTFESATVLTHAVVESGDDFADTAREGAHELLGIDVDLDSVERVRRKVSTSDDGEEVVAHEVVYAASPADGADLPDDAPSCQVESTDWYDSLPEDFAHGHDEMCADARLFVE